MSRRCKHLSAPSTRAAISLGALSLIAVVVVASGAFIEDPPSSRDLDGDGIDDTLERFFESDEEPGEVEVRSGAYGQLIVRIRGSEQGDRFGYSVATVNDLNLDGNTDLIIGAPKSAGVGSVYIYYGPFTESGPLLMTVFDANMAFVSLDPTDFDVGERVGCISDLDNDGAHDIRIQAWFNDTPTSSKMRTYILSGRTGAPLFTIEGNEPFDPWADVAGDADADGDVDATDEAIILQNMGLIGIPGTLGPGSGDVNNDGIVDWFDFTLVQLNMGADAFAAIRPGGGIVLCDPGAGVPAGYQCLPNCLGQYLIYVANVAPNCNPNPFGDDDGDGIPNINDPDSPEYYPWANCSHPIRDCDNDGTPNWRDPDWCWGTKCFFFFRGDCQQMIPAAPGTLPAPINNPLHDDWVKCHALSDPDRDGIPNYIDHDDDGDGIPDENDPDPYYPCYITGDCNPPQPPPLPEPPPSDDPPNPPPGGSPPPQCYVAIGFWSGGDWWDWLPDYIDSNFTPIWMRGGSNWPNCQWNWSASGVAQIQDQSQPPYATVTLNGAGAGSVTGACQCNDVWNFTAVDMHISLDTIDVTFLDEPPHVAKFLWVNTDDDHGADGIYGQSGVYGQPDLFAAQVSDEDDLVALNLSALIGLGDNPFSQPMWSLAYNALKIRVWFKISSDGAVFNNAYGGPWENPIDKSFNGSTYRLFPPGQWINGMPANRQFWVEGVGITEFDTSIYYGFNGVYVHSETNTSHTFSLWRSISATVAGIYFWCDNVLTPPGGLAWITNTMDPPDEEPSPNPRMPHIRAMCVPLQLTDMNVEWKLQIDYTRNNRNDHDTYGPQILEADQDWHAHQLFGNDFRGGQAMITAKLPSLGNKSLKTIFAIRAKNPPEQVVIDFIGNERWYDRYIAAHEGGVQNGRKYLQFNEPGTGTPGSLSTSGQCTPNWGNDGPGQPGGFGIFQLTRFGNPERLPNSQELWNWQQNVITAKQVILEKKAIADNWMQGQRAQAGNVLVPIHVVAGVTFADNSPKPIEDAVAIKAYNSATLHYCYWNNATQQWGFHQLNGQGVNYVQLVCELVQE